MKRHEKMKIRLKYTGEVVEADVNIDGNGKFIGFMVNRLGIPGAEIFYPKEAVAEAPDWDAYRREAAKAAMQGILSGGADWQSTLTECREDGRCEYPSEIANFAVACADALIKQLQGK